MDTAPTGETLRLLSFPEVSDWYFERLYGMFRNMMKMARFTVGKVMNTPLPSEEFLKDIEIMGDRMKAVQKILHDPEITSIRLVVNPEKMVINETKRAFTYLCLYNLTVECLVINRLIPEDSRLITSRRSWRSRKVHEDHRRVVQPPEDAQGLPAPD